MELALGFQFSIWHWCGPWKCHAARCFTVDSLLERSSSKYCIGVITKFVSSTLGFVCLSALHVYAYAYSTCCPALPWAYFALKISHFMFTLVQGAFSTSKSVHGRYNTASAFHVQNHRSSYFVQLRARRNVQDHVWGRRHLWAARFWWTRLQQFQLRAYVPATMTEVEFEAKISFSRLLHMAGQTCVLQDR